MSKVSVDRELLLQLFRCWDCGLEVDNELAQLRIAAAHPAEAEGVELVPFWVLFDATTPEPLIKKHMPEGVLAFFDSEEDARRAKALHPGTDYKRAPYVRAATLSSVTAERDRLREQVAALQSDANSWQSGYDKGRSDGAKAAEGWKEQHCRDSAELRHLCSERDKIRADLAAAIEQRDHYARRVLQLETK